MTRSQSAGLPSGPSSTIEDLADLQQYDDALTGIAERQRALEESQDKAHQVWRDHEQRLRRLEEQLGTTATVLHTQRGHIFRRQIFMNRAC